MPETSSEHKTYPWLRILGMLFFLLTAGIAGWQMLKLPLWGWWPIVFNLSIWLVGVVLLFPKDPEKRKWLGASTLSGVLLGIGFPPSMFTFVVLVAWIPLLAVENGIYQRHERVRPGQMFLFALHAFVLWNVIATFWVTNTAFVAGLIANFVNAAMMATVMMFIHIIVRKLPDKFFAIAFLSIWISFEYLHQTWEASWPWLTLGNALAQYPWAIQWYEWTGVFGGSWWVLGINLIGYNIIVRWLRARPLRIGLYAALLVIPIVVSLLLWFTTKPADANPVSVVVVQPNYEPHFEKFDIPQSHQLLRFLQLSRDAVDENTRYLVFPETSFESVLLNEFRENRAMAQLQQLLDNYDDLNLVCGLSSYRILSEGERNIPSARRHEDRDGKVTHWDIQNSAVQMTSGLQAFQVYFKSKFVPGPEIFPFRRYLSFARPIVDKLGGSYEGHTSQKERSVFTGPLKVAPVICYESVYGDYTGGYVRNGANALFIITNDGWWDLTPGHIQHLKLGALRAIEHRRPIARSANTGISCFIDIRGRILQPTKYGEATTVKGDIIPETRLTFYTRFGDLLAKMAVIGCVIFIIWAMIARFSGREKKII